MPRPQRTATTLPAVAKVLIVLLVLVLGAAALIILQRKDAPSSASAPTVQSSNRSTPTGKNNSGAASGNTAPSPAASTPLKSSPPLSSPSGPATTTSAPDGSASQTTQPSVPPVSVSVKERKTVSADVREYVRSAAEVLADETQPSADELAALATGPAQGALLADAAEFEENGWHQEGTPTIASLNVTSYDPDAAPQQMTVSACIDSSDVQILTANGDPVRAGGGASRSLNILTLIRSDDGNWLVTKVSFPDDPTC